MCARSDHFVLQHKCHQHLHCCHLHQPGLTIVLKFASPEQCKLNTWFFRNSMSMLPRLGFDQATPKSVEAQQTCTWDQTWEVLGLRALWCTQLDHLLLPSNSSWGQGQWKLWALMEHCRIAAAIAIDMKQVNTRQTGTPCDWSKIPKWNSRAVDVAAIVNERMTRTWSLTSGIEGGASRVIRDSLHVRCMKALMFKSVSERA